MPKRDLRSRKSLGKRYNKLLSKLPNLNKISILVIILAICYYILGLKYLYLIDDKENCDCAKNDKRFESLKILVKVCLSFQILTSLIFVFFALKKYNPIPATLKNIVSFYLVIVFVVNVVYSYRIWRFTQNIANNPNCECAEHPFRKIIYGYSIFDLLVKLSLPMMIIGFFVVFVAIFIVAIICTVFATIFLKSVNF